MVTTSVSSVKFDFNKLLKADLALPQGPSELESVAGEKEAWNSAKPAVTDENGWMDDSALVLKTKCVLHELIQIICFSSLQGFIF